MSAFVSAIIVAAGGSTRMGSSDSKQFIALSGKTVIERTLTTFQHCGLIKEIVVVCREQDCERIREIADANAFSKVSAVVKGGDSRAHSVKNGISAASPRAEYYAIHDGARPLVTAEEIERVVKAAFETGAAALGTPVTDTIKVVDQNDIIENTPQRSRLRAVQTPQVFEAELYSFALENAGNLDSFTDDCSLIEKMGGEVKLVDGSKENIKLTTPVDIIIAESIIHARGEDK